MLQPRAAASGSGAGTGVAIDPIQLLKKYYLLLLIAMFAGAVIGAAGQLILARVWPQFTSAATFACYPPTIDTKTLSGNELSQDALNRYMGSEMVTMTSPPVLNQVLEEACQNAENLVRAFISAD